MHSELRKHLKLISAALLAARAGSLTAKAEAKMLSVEDVVFRSPNEMCSLKNEPPLVEGSVSAALGRCRASLGEEREHRKVAVTLKFSGTDYRRQCVSAVYLPQLIGSLNSRISGRTLEIQEVLVSSLIVMLLHPYKSSNGKTARLFTQCFPAGRNHRSRVVDFYSNRFRLWWDVVPPLTENADALRANNP